MPTRLSIGVDIGATKIAFLLMTRQGEILAERCEFTYVSGGPDAILGRVAEGILYLRSLTDIPVDGVGIGCPGTVNPYSGVVLSAANLGWRGVALRHEIQERLPDKRLPIWIQNDVNATALGEMMFGAARGCEDFVYIAIGTGLGAGAIASGTLVEGAHSQAMEVGHLSFGPDGRRCGCGRRGCPEMYASGMGFTAGFKEHRVEWPGSGLSQFEEPSTAEILHAARLNDPFALYLVEEAIIRLAPILLACVRLLNPALFVLGGGIGLAAFDLFSTGLQQRIATFTEETHEPAPRLVRSGLANSAIGAACLSWYYEERSRIRPDAFRKSALSF
jgi:glucokinase